MKLPKKMPEYPWNMENRDSCSYEDARKERLLVRDYQEQRKQCARLRSKPIYAKIMSLAGRWK
ncbi:MAG: hypothetical protein LBS60_08955 [Deltaproteobacteria bacterium]|jgi:hypothetical protein|nr:hypothetical protein [Deltaproteobacteria bacterium]